MGFQLDLVGCMCIYIYWLVVSTPLNNISQLGLLFAIYEKIKHVPNQQPIYIYIYNIYIYKYTYQIHSNPVIRHEIARVRHVLPHGSVAFAKEKYLAAAGPNQLYKIN